MTTRRVSFGRDDPPEYENTNPVNCTVCNAEWDADDDWSDEFITHPDTDDIVCRGRCFDILEERLGGEMGDEPEFELEEAA